MKNSSSALPDPSLPAPPLSDEDEGFTAQQLISRQKELEDAAREAVPFSFVKGGCTYERGYIRQPVFACRTCGGGGVCAGCSVGCHADHDLVELFAKRSFRCDCGTLSLCRGKAERESKLPPCNLRRKDLKYAPQNDENIYCKNFEGQFCHCERGKLYDPENEEETMFQCLKCENWVHESCTSLRPSKEIDDFESKERNLADGPLVEHESFELFLCHDCVSKDEFLQSYAGHRGWIICVPTTQAFFLPDTIDDIPAINVEAKGVDWSHLWKIYGLDRGLVESMNGESGADNALKRKAEEGEQPCSPPTNSKRLKSDEILQVMDSFSETSQDGKDGPDQIVIQDSDEDLCTGGMMPLFLASESQLPMRSDIFLTEGFRNRLCRCSSCGGANVKKYPWLWDAEETYSPPRSHDGSRVEDDAQSEGGASQTSSTYDLGLAALQRLPRAQMMESLEAYNKMRDALFDHLRPFAESGRVVDGDSLREFFRRQKENHHSASS